MNASAATLTKNRTEDSVVPLSGMCVTCVDGCIGMCEIGKSAYRGHEVIYPQPFGILTAAAEKNYPVDYTHFNIMGTAVGAVGIEADPDKAIFPNVKLEQTFGAGNGLKVKFPCVVPGLGSTNVAKNNWEGLAIGAALSGIMLTIGENVVAMDMTSVIKKGKILKAPDLENRIKLYQDWQRDGDLGVLAGIAEEVAPHHEVERLVGAAKLNVGVDHDRVVPLHTRVEELVKANGAFGLIALGEIVTFEKPGHGHL